MARDVNEATWHQKDVVQYYGRAEKLQPPERVILDELRPRLEEAAMLDIGVGGGRTTIHFAPLVKKYMGVDYSPPMIEACKRRFDGRLRNAEFATCDARDLSSYETSSFDFILFSHNGIDSVDHVDRPRVFREAHRVGKKGGHFCVSTHNLQSARGLFFGGDGVGKRNPIGEAFAKIRRAKIRKMNPPIETLESKEYAVLNDGAFQFRITTYYVKPEAQIAELEKCGFESVRVFALSNGSELRTQSERTGATDPWLYYLATIAK